jgi:hypothetical protein
VVQLDGVVYRGLSQAYKWPINQPINTLSGLFRALRDLRDLITRANANQKPPCFRVANSWWKHLHCCSEILRVGANNIAGNFTPVGVFGGASPQPPLEHVAMDSTNHDRLAFAPPVPDTLLYCIRYRDGFRDKRVLTG